MGHRETEKVKQPAGRCRLLQSIDTGDGTVESNILAPEKAPLVPMARLRVAWRHAFGSGVLVFENATAGRCGDGHRDPARDKYLAGRESPANFRSGGEHERSRFCAVGR